MNKYFIKYLELLFDTTEQVNEETEVSMKYKKTLIKKRNDGRWYARYKISNGNYKDIYGKTQKECYDKLKQYADSNKEIKCKTNTKKKTFKEFYSEWLNKEKINHT